MYNKTSYLCASIYLRQFQFAFGKMERYNFQGNNNIDLIKFNTCFILFYFLVFVWRVSQNTFSKIMDGRGGEGGGEGQRLSIF